ncbi:hypothetical protein GCM10011579_066590 [Streptomyces albiflavescens]|uniref:Uncharacterized protein n=1 Tax=Streptomyces albiflavescens TaxID=1623582 RepID=A0A918D8J4_9ACTN|nr:hypothetical protein GCM10011579_066590 [Streptomyces albiflavescens]
MNIITKQPDVRSRVTPLRSLLGGTYVPRRGGMRPVHRNTSSESSQIEGSLVEYSRGTRDDV